MSRILRVVLLSTSVFCIGCSKPQLGEPQLPTSPVSGVVHVDGKPAAGLAIECHPDGDSGIKYSLSALTDQEGKFVFNTYEEGDGLPEGTYSLVFKFKDPENWAKDQFKGKYSDPLKSAIKATVVNGKPTDMGVIELSTKKEN